MKRCRFFFVVIYCMLPCFVYAQHEISFGENIRFANYLLGQKQYDDADLLLTTLDTTSLNYFQKDTLHYLLGWSYYNQKKLALSTRQLLDVSASSGYFLKSHFFGAYNLSYLGKEDSALSILHAIPVKDTFFHKIVNLELAGIALLKRNYPAFNQYRNRFSYNFYATAEQEKSLETDASNLEAIHHKSAVLAGLMSAVIPGSGKAYAGKPMQGLGALLPIMGLGIVTWETYHKKGTRDPLLYVFGTAFTVFYIGDIWGSALSVKIVRDEHEKLIDQQVLLDMHIPLRTIFN
jgi:hypothetical protein